MTPMKRTEPANTSPMTRRRWLALGAIVAAGLAMRLVYIHQIRLHPLFTTLSGDPALYMARAREILQGSPVPDHAYFHSSPLYPFFLALVAKLAGPGLDAVRIVQSCVGALSVALVFALGRLTLGVRTGFAAAAFAAVYVPFVFFDGEYLEISLVIAFVLGSLLTLESADRTGRTGRAAVAGVLLGLAGLGKPNLLLFAPVGAFWLCRAAWLPLLRRGQNTADDTRGRLLRAVLFFAAAGVVILPATVHNYRVEDDLIPVSSNAGINFYIGNHTGSPGLFQAPPEMRRDLRVASLEIAERETGRRLSAGEVSDYWMDRTLGQIGEAPGRWLGLMGRKFILFWNHYEVPNHHHLEFVKGFAPVLRLPVGTFAVVAPLGLLGLGLAIRRRRRVGLLVLFGVTFMVSVIPFFITGRYRLAIVPVLLVGAGHAVVSLWAAARQRAWRTLAVAAAVVAALAAAVGVDTVEFDFAPMHNAVGTVLARQDDLGAAAAAFEKALAENPDDLSSRYNLGRATLELGRPDEAAGHFAQVLARNPRDPLAWLGLGRAHAAAGRVADARAAWRRVLSMAPPAPESLRATAARLLSSLPDGEPTGSHTD